MSDLVNIQIDGVDMQVPKGETIVDAAMRHGVKIPVFCHHPKLEPVGMCRMCLVDVGTPVRDRATGEVQTDDSGEVQYRYGQTLQTGCTVRVSEGMRIKHVDPDVKVARESVIEFLLTSHPLDCPVCDKGGECPLQNLTMSHGGGSSRFSFADKIQNQYSFDKQVPLGDLIKLDRERCIQCARCTRFQSEIADDNVIAFHNRGRRLEIDTMSDPGFDSIWSGNTTDICPVGALTTSDFRFGARAWELVPVASLSPHGPVGENITMSTRREVKAGGRTVIKRIMPRQNELVNEIWIPDHARFVHHFAESSERLTKPMIRKNGELVESSWDEALTLVAQKLQDHRKSAVGLAGDRLSNEDLYLFNKLFRDVLMSQNIDLANRRLAGGNVTASVGIGRDTNLSDLGKGDVVVVVATDLHAEAPIWWLRLKQAAERGATIVTINSRQTRLDKHATHAIQAPPVELLKIVSGLESSNEEYATTIRDADNLLVYYGYEGLSYDQTDVLAKMLGNLLISTKHLSSQKNGLVAVWPECNTQGAWDMGIVNEFAPGINAVSTAGMGADDVYASRSGMVYIAGADPIGDRLMQPNPARFLVVQDLFMTETAKAADVVLPRQSWAERDGTWTNGDRRIQRFYQAITPMGESRPDWKIFGGIINRITQEKEPFATSLIFKALTTSVSTYADISYRTLAESIDQFPKVGGDDLYYGGTSYENNAGTGQVWATTSETTQPSRFVVPGISKATKTEHPITIAIPASYELDNLTRHTALIQDRITPPTVHVNAQDATEWKVSDGQQVSVEVNGINQTAHAHVNGVAPSGTMLVQGFGTAAQIGNVTFQ